MTPPLSTSLDADAIRGLVAEVVRRIQAGALPAPTASAVAKAAATTPRVPVVPPAGVIATAPSAGVTIPGRVVALAMLEKLPPGVSRILIEPAAVVTPSARDHARSRGLVIDRTSATAGPAAPRLPFLVAHAECGPAAVSQAAAVVRAIPQAMQLPASGIADLVAAIALHASRDGARGLLLAGRPALAAAVANRSASLRAVTARDPAGLAAAAAECNANLLVVDPASFPGAAMVRLAGELAARPAGETPALLATRPAGCGCKHPGGHA
ncbi:MAG: hypothetical protein RLZZ440_613 [Planctomycetota bacterium]